MYSMLNILCLAWCMTAINTACSIGCKYNSCHVDTVCSHGCTPGYTNNTCIVCNYGYHNYNRICCPNTLCRLCSSDTTCLECQPGWYGKRCNSICSVGCGLGRCTLDDGLCTCKQGYKGSKCTQCRNGWYKNQHTMLCHECSNLCSTCDSLYRCTSCPTGYYGRFCQTPCSSGCSGAYNECNGTNGICLNGCNKGYTGDTCSQCKHGWYTHNEICQPCPNHCPACTSSTLCLSCTAGFYGQLCKIPCSFGCSGAHSECEKYNGRCLNGCKEGFLGIKCDHCIDRKWGAYCNEECPGTCNRCLSDISCATCDAGYYGTVCQLTCSPGCRSECDKYTGACSLCKAGFSGNKCCVKNNNCKICSSNSVCLTCVTGYYGYDCGTKCSAKCKGSCDKTTGDCVACIKGFSGPKCGQNCLKNCVECDMNGTCIDCAPNFYGSSCNQSCPINCKTCTEVNSCGECQEGFFGEICSKSCPEHCVSCISNTTCSVCKEGFTGHYKCQSHCSRFCRSCLITNQNQCTKCVRGRYGTFSFNNFSDCQLSCSKNCLQDFCDERNGKCTKGCITGYTGDKCECPENCQNGCNRDTGDCDICNKGYSGSKCSCLTQSEQCNELICESCRNNSWYRTTNACCKCSGTCRNNQCQDSDTCSYDCEDGYYGVGCKDRCSQRDISCLACTNETCSHCVTGFYPSINFTGCISCPEYCVNGNCSGSNGICLEGCKKGYWGKHCDIQCGTHCEDCNRYTGVCNICENGLFTRNCTKNCSSDCLINEGQVVCDIDNGQCVLGCSRGMVYGVYCDTLCNSTCLEQTCNWRSGRCLKGCISKYFGDWCEHKCSETCTENPSDRKCSVVDGSCMLGCHQGYFGVTCESECGNNCVNKTCERLDGNCTYGCISGYEGKSCAKVLELEDYKITGMVIGAVSGVVTLLTVLAIITICLVMRSIRIKGGHTNTTNCSFENHGHSNILLDDIEPIHNNAPTSANVSLFMNDQRKSTATKAENPAYENHTSLNIFTKSQSIKRGQRKSNLEERQQEKLDLQPDEIERDNLVANLQEGKEPVFEDKRQSVNGPYQYAEAIAQKGVTVGKLADYVAGKSKDDIIKEFLSIPKGLTKPCACSQQRKNLGRNRYKSVYPYDINRVKLRTGSSDYINASYIDGFNKERAYIAALGPTETTTDMFVTFWAMVWQENVEKIVMLTKLVENTRMKCEQYWPYQGTDVDYGDVTVASLAVEQYSEFDVRTFSVTKNSEKRMLYHFHYTAWPDKSVPDDVTGLLEFRNKVLATKSSLEGPVVVHCSAGIGRTGTYIALDYLTKEGEETGSVDILSCFTNLRAQRVCMIQAEEQYIYLHHAVVHSLTFESKLIPGDTFQEYTKTLDADTLQTKFAKLDYGAPKDERESIAVNRNRTYTTKNHPQADIPGDRYRPKLYMSRAFGDSDYINAVYLDSFRAKNHYVVTQTPLKETIEDFLTLLCQEQFSCVVDMQPNEPNRKDMGEYLPVDNQISKHGCFIIEGVRVKSNDEFVLRQLIITNNTESRPEQRTIHHYQYTGWNYQLAVPPLPANFISFVSEVETEAKQEFGGGKVLLHCISGAERSCLFGTVSVMMQKMASEQEVSVVNVIRQIRLRRPKAIPTKEQYMFCHQCVGASLDTFDTYSNVALRQ